MYSFSPAEIYTNLQEHLNAHMSDFDAEVAKRKEELEELLNSCTDRSTGIIGNADLMGVANGWKSDRDKAEEILHKAYKLIKHGYTIQMVRSIGEGGFTEELQLRFKAPTNPPNTPCQNTKAG